MIMTLEAWKRLAAVVLLSALGWPTLSARNLILISVDTLRADRLSCYGYSNNPTPVFDRWASEGVRFERAYTENPLTLPAHATLFTGIYPPSHGIRENIGFRLHDDYQTLAECFQEAGFTTAGFIGSYVLASQFGVAQGFQVFDETFDRTIESVVASTEIQRSADQVTDRFLAWLEENRSDRFFAFVHFYDPHTPRPRGYDWEVSRVDRNLGRIDRYLKEQGLLADTDIILTSDHGESLGEHGEQGHGFFVYDSTLHVPLIVRPASSSIKRGLTIADQVSLADLMPTILSMHRLEIPSSVQGRSLLPLLEGETLDATALYAETFVPSFHFGWSPLRSLRLGRYKYIQAPRGELYDLQTDPGESDNLYRKEGATARRYRTMLEEWLSTHDETPAQSQSQSEASSDILERLASLGYVSPGAGRSQTASRIDPKDRIEAFERYHAVLNRLSSGSADPSLLGELEEITRSAPEMQGIDFLRGWTHERLNRLEEARRHYQRSVERDPENLLGRARYAGLLIRMRDYEDAERQLLQILEQAPADYRARNNLAGLYHLTGRPLLAAEQLRIIVQARPGYAAAWQNLGNLLLGSEDWNGAEEAFRRVLELDPENAAAHFQLSRALREMGREAESEQERERAEELDPRLRNRP